MTRQAALALLLFATLAAPSPSAPPTPRVLIIGIDGCRLDAIEYSQALHLKSLMKDGAVSTRTDVLGDRKTRAETITGPGWSSALTGVWADKHGVVDNGFKWTNFKAYPNVLARLRQARPKARTAALHTWRPFQDHLFTEGDGARLVVDGDKRGYEAGDRAVGEAGERLLAKADVDLVFAYFGNVDSAGHGYGFHPRSPKYTNAIEQVDLYVGRLLAALRKRPDYLREDWLIIVCTDHGGKGRNHAPGATEPEMRTGFLILHGASVVKGKVSGRTYNVDVAATALAHLGVKIDPKWKLDGSPVARKGAGR